MEIDQCIGRLHPGVDGKHRLVRSVFLRCGMKPIAGFRIVASSEFWLDLLCNLVII
jgi:hypothetical protein